MVAGPGGNGKKCDKCKKPTQESELKLVPGEFAMYDNYYCPTCYAEHEKNKPKYCRGCENTPLPGKGYCAEHKKEFECKECQQEVGKDPGETKETLKHGYKVEIGEKVERDHNQAEKFILCPDCWNKKKEGYKSYLGKNPQESKIVVQQVSYSKSSTGYTGLGNCKVCQKWSDEYKGVSYGGYIDMSICSADCQRKYDKENDDPQERERERERQKSNNYTNEYRN